MLKRKEEAKAGEFSQDRDRIVVPEEVRGSLLTLALIALPGIEGVKSGLTQEAG